MPEITQEDKVTVEAETVEAALAEISQQFGEDAEIVRAQKVHRGGVGGFFAKEMVQLTARRRHPAAPVSPAPSAPPKSQADGIAGVLERMAQDADAADGDFRTVLQRELSTRPSDSGSEGFLTAVGWEAGTDDTDTTPAPDAAPGPDAEINTDATEEHVVPAFADREVEDLPEPVVVGPVLQVAPAFPGVDDEIEDIPPSIIEVEAAESTPAAAQVLPFEFPTEPEIDETAVLKPIPDARQADVEPEVPSDESVPVESPQSPPGMGRVNWGKTALLRLGMPAPIIEAIVDLDPSDDLSWIEAIAATVAEHCGPLPSDDVIVVGPHAERLAEPLGLPLVHAGDMAPYAGSFCAMVEDTTRDREWLEYVQGGRGIHLVIGDEPWQDLLIGEPVAVSWVGESAVSDALYLAFTLGATLGYGTVDGFVSSMVRAQPTDVALAVRRIVGRR